MHREGRVKGMATGIRMDERGQIIRRKGNCGAKREGLFHESGIYGDRKGQDKEGKKRISILRSRIKGISKLKVGSMCSKNSYLSYDPGIEPRTSALH